MLNRGQFVAGGTPWNKGIEGTHFSTQTEFKKGDMANDLHPGWKGDQAGYSAIHKWVNRHFGSPSKCEQCETEKAKKYEWANISGDYTRERSDWLRLCVSCHRRMDRSGFKMWATRRAKACV